MKRALALGAAIAVAAAASALALTRPDPASQAQADGCQRTFGGLVSRQAPNWVYVNDKDYPATAPAPPPQWAGGVVGSPFAALGSHPSPVDDPFVHTSYDVNFNLAPDAASSTLVGGDPVAQTGNFATGSTSLGGETDLSEALGRLHVELEQTAYPTFAWPEPGNRVHVLGNWVWDCGHWENGGERTELHPFRALWVERPVSPRSPYGEAEGDLLITSNATFAGASADCAHTTKGNGPAFKSCLASSADWQDPRGSYSFSLPAPPKPAPAAKLRIRVVDEGSVGAPAVSVAAEGAGARVSVTVTASPNQKVIVAKQVFVGWAPLPASVLPVHFHLSFLSLLVRRAMDPGCPNGVKQCGSVETTRGDQISQPPGEFNMYWDVAGIWSPWEPALFTANDGQLVPGRQTVDVYVPRGRPWRVLTTGRECDFGSVNIVPCPHTGEFGNATGDDEPGLAVATFRSRAAAVGLHKVNAALAPSTCPPANKDGCYQVTFRVSVVGDAAKRAAARR